MYSLHHMTFLESLHLHVSYICLIFFFLSWTLLFIIDICDGISLYGHSFWDLKSRSVVTDAFHLIGRLCLSDFHLVHIFWLYTLWNFWYHEILWEIVSIFLICVRLNNQEDFVTVRFYCKGEAGETGELVNLSNCQVIWFKPTRNTKLDHKSSVIS